MIFGHLSEDLSAYLDGELDPTELSRVKGHLPGCEVCRQELSSLMTVRAMLRSLPMLELPTIAGTPAPVIHLRGKPKLIWGTAAAAVAAVVVVMASLGAPRDVIALTQDDFSAPYLARQSFDPSSTGRLIPPDVMSTRLGSQGETG